MNNMSKALRATLGKPMLIFVNYYCFSMINFVWSMVDLLGF